MHIPPGFLKPQVWIPMTGVSASFVGYALKKSGDLVDERKTPLMGVMAAFIFAAQMVNFPVFGGTSGHLIGSALAVSVLGMWPSMVVMTAVVLVQALLFQDGGLGGPRCEHFQYGHPRLFHIGIHYRRRKEIRFESFLSIGSICRMVFGFRGVGFVRNSAFSLRNQPYNCCTSGYGTYTCCDRYIRGFYNNRCPAVSTFCESRFETY